MEGKNGFLLMHEGLRFHLDAPVVFIGARRYARPQVQRLPGMEGLPPLAVQFLLEMAQGNKIALQIPPAQSGPEEIGVHLLKMGEAAVLGVAHLGPQGKLLLIAVIIQQRAQGPVGKQGGATGLFRVFDGIPGSDSVHFASSP